MRRTARRNGSNTDKVEVVYTLSAGKPWIHYEQHTFSVFPLTPTRVPRRVKRC